MPETREIPERLGRFGNVGMLAAGLICFAPLLFGLFGFAGLARATGWFELATVAVTIAVGAIWLLAVRNSDRSTK